MRTWLQQLRDRYSEPPPNVRPEHQRFYVTASYGYPCGLLWHFLFIFLFWRVGAQPLALLNIVATAIWILALLLHLSGRLRGAVVLAALEISVHAACCVVLIGWGAGFQFYILAMAAVVFFAPLGRLEWNIALAALNAVAFVSLHYLFVDVPPRIPLASWIVDSLYYGSALSTFFVISLSAATYDRAAASAEAALNAEKMKSEEMAGLLRRMFGRYLSPEVMSTLIENPAGLELGGEKRHVTIMMTDLRGFTAMSERLEPEQVVALLNGYFEVMMEVVVKYQGTINEIIGDALLVFFGAPQEMSDRAQQAVACAIEMQNAMARVNERNRAAGLPELQMGIGLNDAEVVVGNIGTTRRSKYTAVGSGVNMTSRIESYTVGGQSGVGVGASGGGRGAAHRRTARRAAQGLGVGGPHLRGRRYRGALQSGARGVRAGVRPAREAHSAALRGAGGQGSRTRGRRGIRPPSGEPLRGARGGSALEPMANLKMNLVSASEGSRRGTSTAR